MGGILLMNSWVLNCNVFRRHYFLDAIGVFHFSSLTLTTGHGLELCVINNKN